VFLVLKAKGDLTDENRMSITIKAVLVTGANRGLGRALVEEALRRGAKRYASTRQPPNELEV
jgi:NAD(P)-dependent dehydrogenase (short-subunit alcohol dehydrogenase family)